MVHYVSSFSFFCVVHAGALSHVLLFVSLGRVLHCVNGAAERK